MDGEQLKAAVKAFALEQGADLVGVASTAHLDRVIPTEYKPSRLWPSARSAISMGKALLRGAAAVGTEEVSAQNARWVAWRTTDFLNNLALELGHFLEGHGGRALPLSCGTMADPDWKNMGIFGELSHRHIAAEAGLGIIGVPSICVTPRFGPRCYFITVLTEAELPPDPRLDWDPCGGDCEDACVTACPNQAISRNREKIRKGRCLPLAMPHGLLALREFILPILGMDDPEEKRKALADYQLARLHRATVHGVGTIAGCFHCLAACPIGSSPNRKGDGAVILPNQTATQSPSACGKITAPSPYEAGSAHRQTDRATVLLFCPTKQQPNRHQPAAK